MANEVVRLVAAGTAPANPIRYSVYDGQAYEKGTIMVFSGAQIIKASSTTGEKFAGIANTEKVANDTQITLGVDTCGIYDCLTYGVLGVAVGDLLMVSGANRLTPIRYDALSGVAVLSGLVAGKALDVVAAGSTDTIAVAIGIY